MSLKSQLESILADKRRNLLPSNIRMGKTVLGVTGTLPAPANNRTVKRFTSFEDMQNDPEPDVNDLAVIYDTCQKDIFSGSFSKINILTDTITLDNMLPGSMYVYIDPATDEYISGQIYIRREYIRLQVYDRMASYDVLYNVSGDGLTYIRDTSYYTGNTITLLASAVLSNVSNLPTEYRDIIERLFSAEGLTFSGVYTYTGYEYNPAPTQFTLSSKSDLFNNVVAYGANGEIVGDGSWINRVTNKQFIDTWLNNSIAKTHSGVLQSGTNVPSQTLVKHKYIAASDISNISPSDCLAYTRTTVPVINDLSNYAILKKSYTDSLSYYTMYNDIPYYVFCGWTYDTYNAERGYRYAKNLFYYVVNLLTMQIDHQGSTTQSIQLMNVQNVSSGVTDIQRYFGYIRSIGFNFNNNTLYGYCGQNNYGWSHGAKYRTFSLNSAGTLNVLDGNFNGGTDYRVFYNPVWDNIHFGWVARLACWPSGGSNTYHLCYINCDGSATIKLSGAGAGYNITYDTTDHIGLGSILPIYYANADGTYSYYLYDVYNGVKISAPIIDTYSRYYYTGCGKYVYAYAKTSKDATYYSIFRIDSTTDETVLIYTTNSTGTNYIYPIMLDGSPCFATTNKVYDMYGVYKGYYYVNTKVYAPIGIAFTDTGAKDLWYPSFSLDTATYTATSNRTVELFEVYSDIDTLPITDGNLAIVCDESTYTKQNYMSKNNARLLTNIVQNDGPMTQEEYDTALQTATEIRG